MEPNRIHEANAVRIMKVATGMRVEMIDATARSALVFAVLDLAQAVRELGVKSEVPGND